MKVMEPSHPTDDAFWWTREEFLELKPWGVFKKDGGFILKAGFEGETWAIDFVWEDEQWKIDWIRGYRPKILDMQEENEQK